MPLLYIRDSQFLISIADEQEISFETHYKAKNHICEDNKPSDSRSTDTRFSFIDPLKYYLSTLFIRNLPLNKEFSRLWQPSSENLCKPYLDYFIQVIFSDW